MRRHYWLTALCLGVAAPAVAGPPYLTDDPVPTDKGHWEIYAFDAGEGHRSTLDSDVGLDLNYGAVEGVQLTATLPFSFSHAVTEGWHGGTGDVELGVKYRFFYREADGVSAAIFPRVILPTASHVPDERAQFLLPVWLGEDFKSGTSIFGGGGYQINPGAGKRDFWQAGLAITQELSNSASVGAEITMQGPDVDGGTRQIRAGLGSTIKLSENSGLLFSGGPTFADHQTGFHFYAALGLNY